MFVLNLLRFRLDLDWICADSLVILVISLLGEEYCPSTCTTLVSNKKVSQITGMVIRNRTLPAASRRLCDLLPTFGASPRTGATVR